MYSLPARDRRDQEAALSDRHNLASAACRISANAPHGARHHGDNNESSDVEVCDGRRERIDGGPRSAIVVGAGIVGLSTAWFLQERGVDVTVVDRTGVAAGASWGNAGWISPALTLPLNSPGVLRYGLRVAARPGRTAAHPHDRRLRTRGLPGAVRRQLSAFVVETGGARQRAAQRGSHRSLRRARRQRRRRPGHRRPDHRVVPQHRTRRAHAARASRTRKRRADNGCHRAGRRGATRTSAPGIAGDHRRAEHQRSTLRRPRPLRARAGPSGRRARRNDAHGWKFAACSAPAAGSRCTRAAASR